MKTLCIKPKGWGHFQHYKNRRPPWIKLHRTILDDYEYQCLQLASKALAPCLWLIASEHDEGLIVVDLPKLSWRLRVDENTLRQSIIELINKGFFEVASGLLAECLQGAIPEKETETEKTLLSSDDEVTPLSPSRGRTTRGRRSVDTVPYQEIVDQYNRILSAPPYNRPYCRLLDDKRKRLIKRIWDMSDKTKTLEWWEAYWQACTGNSHWMYGTKHTGGTWAGANLDFLLHQDRFKAVVEG